MRKSTAATIARCGSALATVALLTLAGVSNSAAQPAPSGASTGKPPGHNPASGIRSGKPAGHNPASGIRTGKPAGHNPVSGIRSGKPDGPVPVPYPNTSAKRKAAPAN